MNRFHLSNTKKIVIKTTYALTVVVVHKGIYIKTVVTFSQGESLILKLASGSHRHPNAASYNCPVFLFCIS
jgi:hypothetical protein